MAILATYSNANGDGRVYPDSCEVRCDGVGAFEVWDTTGWNGFEVCADELIAVFKNANDALQFAQLKYARWSNPVQVIDAAIALLDKESGSFKNLKAAVDWRDLR